jgi:hypothetical protein
LYWPTDFRANHSIGVGSHTIICITWITFKEKRGLRYTGANFDIGMVFGMCELHGVIGRVGKISLGTLVIWKTHRIGFMILSLI